MNQLPPEIVGKAISDPKFREQLFRDPKAALEAAGIKVDPKVIDAVSRLDRSAVEAFITGLDSAVGDQAAG